MEYTITQNTQFNSLEIKFEKKPEQKTIEILKSFKFKWHNAKQMWYGFARQEELEEALNTQKEAKHKESKSEIVLKDLTMITDFEEIYELIKKFYYDGCFEKTRYNEDKKEVEYFNKIMNEYMFFKTSDNLTIYLKNKKPIIKSQLLYDDETIRPDNNYNNFENYNLRNLKYSDFETNEYKMLFKSSIPGITDITNCWGYCRDEEDYIRTLTESETEDIKTVLNSIKQNYIIRLKTYWKRYQNKIRWSGYWANR